MTENLTTDPPAAQLALFRDIHDLLEAEEQSHGRYTLERFKVRRPDAYKLVVELLGSSAPGSEGMRRIAKAAGVHHMTVAAVRDEAGEAIDTVRSKTVRGLRLAADLQLERLHENPEIVPPHVIALAVSQLIDKAELLDGRATTRTEHTERVEIHGDWNTFLEQALPTERQLTGEQVTEIPPAALPAPVTGSAGKKSGVLSELELPDPAPGADVETDAQPAAPEASPPEATAQTTDPEPAAVTHTDPSAGVACGRARVQAGPGGGSEVATVAVDLIPRQPSEFLE